jgi:dTDP-4-amino-4,6-dideoxygalactose transaminase
MTDLAAAMGIVQLGKLEQMYKRRQEIASKYDAAFGPHPALETPKTAPYSTHAYHLYILRLRLDALSIDRGTFISHMREANIGTSVHWMPLHMHPYYRKTYGYQPEEFPVAYEEYQRIISLPIYSSMSDADVSDVIAAVTQIAGQFGR